jgi:hypothetical protein
MPFPNLFAVILMPWHAGAIFRALHFLLKSLEDFKPSRTFETLEENKNNDLLVLNDFPALMTFSARFRALKKKSEVLLK